MSLSPVILDAMLAAGCTAEQIVAAVKAEAQEQDARAARKREADAARKRRQREKETVGHAESRGHSVTGADSADMVSPKKETSPTPPKEKTTPSQSEANASSKTPRAALETVLDAERAGQVVEHRQRIRKPLTVKAAELLASQFAKCDDPNAGADAMVLNGWQGFNPAWVDRAQPRGSPAPRASTTSALANSARNLAQSMRSADEIRSGSSGGSVRALVSHLPVR